MCLRLQHRKIGRGTLNYRSCLVVMSSIAESLNKLFFGASRVTTPLIGVEFNDSRSLNWCGVKWFSKDVPVLTQGDQIGGIVRILVNGVDSYGHLGIELNVIQQYKSKINNEVLERFCIEKKVIANRGSIPSSYKTQFTLYAIKFPMSSYSGLNIDVSFSLEVRIKQRFVDIVKDFEFGVLLFDEKPANFASVAIPIDFDGLFSMEAFFPANFCDSMGCLIGTMVFKHVSVKIVKMMISVLTFEEYSGRAGKISKSGVVKEFELMDGSPVVGERIPIRLFLGEMRLGREVRAFQDTELSVKHQLRICVTDHGDKNYFYTLRLRILCIKPDLWQVRSIM
jgi:vacuolar protein sorting-associated protein 26